MLSIDFDKRPNISKVFDILKSSDLLSEEVISKPIITDEKPVSGLRISKNLKATDIDKKSDDDIKPSKGLVIKGLNIDK
jgi:hypothetical protein